MRSPCKEQIQLFPKEKLFSQSFVTLQKEGERLKYAMQVLDTQSFLLLFFSTLLLYFAHAPGWPSSDTPLMMPSFTPAQCGTPALSRASF